MPMLAVGGGKRRMMSREMRARSAGCGSTDDPPSLSNANGELPGGAGVDGGVLAASAAAGRALLRRAVGRPLAAGWRWASRAARGLGDAAGRVVDHLWNGPEESDQGAAGGGGRGVGAGSGGTAGGGGAISGGGLSDPTGSYETHILEDSLQKIGALLAVGFGDAGAEIIAENIRKRGDLNPMVRFGEE